jgi:hypothetical protein
VEHQRDQIIKLGRGNGELKRELATLGTREVAPEVEPKSATD